MGFANSWSDQPSCQGPTEPGLGALPQLLTNACIQKGPAWLRSPALWDGCALTHCGGCGAGTVGDKVLEYQRSGKRVILSVSACTPLTPTMWYTALSVCITTRIPLPSSLCMHLTCPYTPACISQVGGANSDATDMDPAKGIALADALWHHVQV